MTQYRRNSWAGWPARRCSSPAPVVALGLAIAKKVAADGANVALIAKTADPHPRLPGTVYTAAEEIEAAGGHALPIVGDIRFNDQVEDAVGRDG